MDAAVDASLADEDEREQVELAKAASLDGDGRRRSGRLAARRDSSGSIELDRAGREANRGDAEDDAAGWGGAGPGFFLPTSTVKWSRGKIRYLNTIWVGMGKGFASI